METKTETNSDKLNNSKTNKINQFKKTEATSASFVLRILNVNLRCSWKESTNVVTN